MVAELSVALGYVALILAYFSKKPLSLVDGNNVASETQVRKLFVSFAVTCLSLDLHHLPVLLLHLAVLLLLLVLFLLTSPAEAVASLAGLLTRLALQVTSLAGLVACPAPPVAPSARLVASSPSSVSTWA
jgi:hypothetical protein